MAAVVDDDPERAKENARGMMVGLARMQSPYYVNLLRMGYTEEELTSGADRAVDDILAHGPVEAVAAKAREHLDAGADHVVVNPAGAGLDLDRVIEIYERLALCVL